MLSRVAERLYWFARYVERAENTARLLLVQHHLVLDLPGRVQPGWGLMIDVLGAGETFRKVPGRANEKNVISFAFGNRDNPGSIINCLRYARENMRTTREVMPKEVWERINSLYLSVAQRHRQELPRSVRHRILNDVIQRCQQINGLLADCMLHEHGYNFLLMGRNLERADMSTRIIDVGTARLTGTDEENIPYRGALWVGVLKSLSAYQMYLQTVQHNVNPKDVLAFLLCSPTFPRAVDCSLRTIESNITELPRNAKALAAIGGVRELLANADLQQLSGTALHGFIDDLQLRLLGVHDTVYSAWFAPELAA
jgi:uncharacterized alpha-E superfamily protein